MPTKNKTANEEQDGLLLLGLCSVDGVVDVVKELLKPRGLFEGFRLHGGLHGGLERLLLCQQRR